MDTAEFQYRIVKPVPTLAEQVAEARVWSALTHADLLGLTRRVEALECALQEERTLRARLQEELEDMGEDLHSHCAYGDYCPHTGGR